MLFEEKLEHVRALLEYNRTGEPVSWEGTTRDATRQAARVSHHGKRSAVDVDRRRRKPGVGGTRGAPWTAAHAGDHRRRPATVRAVRRALPPRAGTAGKAARCRWACIRQVTSPSRTRRRARSCARRTPRCGTGSAPSVAGHRPAVPSSSTRSNRDRCMSARPTRSRGRSRRRCRGLASRAST